MQTVRRLSDIPPAGTAFEQLRSMRGDRLAGLMRFNAEQGDIGRFAFVFGDVMLANSPALVHDILVTHAGSFQKSPILRSALFPLAGEGLFTSEGELWRRQRKLMAPLFKQSGLGHFASAMIDGAARAARTWRDGEVIDVARETTRITMAVAGKALFDTDTFDEADELGAALTTALEWAGVESASVTLIVQARLSIGLGLLADRMAAPWEARLREASERLVEPFLWPGPRSRALREAVSILDRRVARMIAERRSSAEGRRDLLSLLLSARDDEGKPMSDRQVRDEVLTLFVAGHETTATALAWSLLAISRQPALLGALRAEVDALGGPPGPDDLPRLGLATRVFKEALRLYTPVYMFGRISTVDVQVDDLLLPKGTVVLISPYALHRRPELWPAPERFDPDRFLPDEEARRPRCAYIPFSAGPRTCIGNHFALMEGPLVLATLLHAAELSPVSSIDPVPEAQATLRPGGGMPMRVRLRR